MKIPFRFITMEKEVDEEREIVSEIEEHVIIVDNKAQSEQAI